MLFRSTITSCVTMNPNMSIYRRLNPKLLVQAGLGLSLLHWARAYYIGLICLIYISSNYDSQTGHVIELHVYSYGLRGMISPSLLELPYLTTLVLGGNDFNQSHIPKFIGSLGNLKFLDLSWANLSGPIPHQFGNISLLQYLHLDNNDLKIVENLEWLSCLSSIEDLDLSSTNLSAANDWLEVVSQLPKLSNLNLSVCDLPPVTDLSFLPQINFSNSLSFLDLSTNHVTQSIFSWLFNYGTSLVEIDLSDNQLGGSIPDTSSKMNSLQTLILDDNQLGGGVPKFFGNMCALQHLSIENNKLSEVEFINNLSGCVQYSLE